MLPPSCIVRWQYILFFQHWRLYTFELLVIWQSGGFSIGYGKSESKLKEKDLTNAKSNLVLGDNVTLNKGADITATNLIHGNISINNGNVKFGARKDVKDVETSSKSSGINLSVKIKSDASL